MSKTTIEDAVDSVAVDVKPIDVTELTLQQRLDLEKKRIRQEALAAPDRIKGIENRIFEKAMGIVDGALGFTDVDFDEDGNPLGIPQEWIDEVGETEAKKRYRATLKGLENSQNAPVVMRMAENMVATIIRARAAEKAAPMNIHVEVAELKVQPREYPELIVDSVVEQDDEY